LKFEAIDKIIDSGLFALFVGIESADKKILRKDFNKTLDPEKIKETIQYLLDRNVFIVSSYIYPAPSENSESRSKTLNYILELFKDPRKSSVSVQFPGILPPSKWGECPEKYGFEVPDKEEYKVSIMTYNIKQYLPPILWGNIDYKMNGKSHYDIVLETTKFIKELESHGVLTMLLDEAAMMASVINYTPAVFKNEMSQYIFTGDYERLKDMISEINNHVK
jgi:radical SAM superfamily enzyme YgiQ (UPF0313 family)